MAKAVVNRFEAPADSVIRVRRNSIGLKVGMNLEEKLWLVARRQEVANRQEQLVNKEQLRDNYKTVPRLVHNEYSLTVGFEFGERIIDQFVTINHFVVSLVLPITPLLFKVADTISLLTTFRTSFASNLKPLAHAFINLTSLQGFKYLLMKFQRFNPPFF